ncbi:inositol monophosphatase [Agromyces sp. CFH 90414]|uniref:Inositol-1-monophosphatase n=1 Tax=Agromyces agglutinans TaxID=2662258 RepID=A0A6I2FA41_9MICO|nr:inositol monophosphatase family protein [Agromyces agglutinans]MRG59590.1 inositol monophosphatase [Agromyces agglutinans]
MTDAEASVPTPESLLALARDIAVRAGAFALEERRKGVSVEATKSTPIDIVTAVDRSTEALIRRLILEARPDDGILGEEGGAAQTGTSGLTWVVDPIDGTVNFLYGIPQWSISIAVVQGPPAPDAWTAVAGVVVNPVSGEVFEASLGGGARLGGEPLHVNASVALDRALVGTGFAYSIERREGQARIVADLLVRIRDLRRLGSCALDLCAVAAGRLDAYYEVGLGPWDHAAGALIAREAGAIVTGPRGGAPTGEFLLAAPAGLHEELGAALAAAGAPA